MRQDNDCIRYDCSPAGGSYAGSVSVTITCGSPDAEIYYTTDDRTPGRSSVRYTGAFTVSAPATVKAVAIKDGLDDSDVATVSYTKEDGGGSGGGNSGDSGDYSGGNEDNGGGNSGGNRNNGGGGSTNPGNGNTAPQPLRPWLRCPARRVGEKNNPLLDLELILCKQ